MLNLLDQLNIKFIMRLPKNRQIRKSMDTLEAKIGDHWEYKLRGNQRMKRFAGFIQGTLRFITAYKKKNRSGLYETRFLISNFEETAHTIVALYEYRWTIEKFFRTVKQKLGLQDCMSRSLEKQKNHIWATFVAYAIADSIKVSKSYKTADEAIRKIRLENREGIRLNVKDWTIFCALA